MVTKIPQIPEPPTPQDPPAQFNQKAADSWAGLYAAVPKMNQQATEIEAVGQAAVAAGQVAEAGSDAAMGYRNEAGIARDAALAHATSASQSSAAAGVACAEAEAAAESAVDAAQRAEAAAEAAESVATSAVLQTSATGAALLPEGTDAQRPAPGSIPAGAFVVRANTGNSADYVGEYWDRVAAAWRVLASRSWVAAKIQELLDAAVGFTIIYPNGGSAASPANVSTNTTYVNANPFPGRHVICEAQVFYAGVWSAAGWMTNNTAGVGVVARQKGNEIHTIVGLSGVLPRANYGGNAFGNSGADVATPLPARVLCWEVKGVQQ